jgi:molecular chaperone GrpE
MFRRKHMSIEDPFEEKTTGEEPVTVPVNDKRRFNEEGRRDGVIDDAPPPPPQRSPREVELEASLKAETERREAAESKLVGVQTKFEDAKRDLEKETAEMRSRLMKTLEGRSQRKQFDFLTTLLPVLDNLNLAIASSEQDPSVDHLRDGVKGTARSFEKALMSVGVEPVPSIGMRFDPELHEAIDMAEVDAEHDGLITAEYSSGYRLGDRLLRPARVQVGRAHASSAAE